MLHFLKPWIGYPCLRSVLLSATKHIQISNILVFQIDMRKSSQICVSANRHLRLKPRLTAQAEAMAACGGLNRVFGNQQSLPIKNRNSRSRVLV